MARTKNVLSVLMQVFMIFCVVALLWAIYGYSLAFTSGNAFIAVSTGCSCRAWRRLAGGDVQQGRLHSEYVSSSSSSPSRASRRR